MKILHNPEDGGPISDVFYKDIFYFDSREGNIFKPGMILAMEDHVADFFLDLYGFLQIVTSKQAEELLKKEKEVFKCERCDFKTSVKIAYYGHQKKHENEKSIEGLGIPMIKGGEVIEPKQVDNQNEIDSQARKDGLEGEGLVDETFKKGAIM